MWSAGGADAVQRRSYQADERSPEWNKSAEALRLGALIQREDPTNSAKGAQFAAQVWLPWRSVCHGLDKRSLSGECEDPVITSRDGIQLFV